MNKISKIPVLVISVCLVVCCGCGSRAQKADKGNILSGSYQSAKSLEQEGKVKEAVAGYQGMIDRNSSAALAHLEVGILLHDHNIDIPRSIYHYRRYLELLPDTEKKDLIKDRLKNAEDTLISSIISTRTSPKDGGLQTNDNSKVYIEVISAKDREIAELKKSNYDLVRKADALQIKYDALSDGNDAEKSALVRNHKQSEEVVPAVTDRETSNTQKTIRTYTVRREDSLSSIALKMYKDGELWPRIYEANQDAIPDKNRLRVGQVLLVP